MIRYIDLTDQIHDDIYCFAWWNTVTEMFMELNECFVWYSWEEFLLDYRRDNLYAKHPLDRFAGLYPRNRLIIENITGDETAA